MGKKHGDAIFLKGGTKQSGERIDLTDNVDQFKFWAEGRTGVPFIDASMIELNTTGYMSNRTRQNAASFLINQLGVNWQMGAEYFESKLIDYDPCSNWGNWNYIAGVGSDPREGRCFNIIKQAERYDADAEFVSHWIPALNKVPKDARHTPYKLSDHAQREYDFILGKDYPHCIVRQQLEYK
jgi:deoxyribodipyrimidine photo-lyase